MVLLPNITMPGRDFIQIGNGQGRLEGGESLPSSRP